MQGTIKENEKFSVQLLHTQAWWLLQVGAHYLKDLFDMFVMEPAKDAAVDSAVDATGTQGYVNSYNSMQYQAQRFAANGQNMLNQFNRNR